MKNSKEFYNYATKHIGIPTTTLEGFDRYSGKTKFPTGMTPSIIEERQMNVAIMSVFDRLMMDRIIFLGTGIDSDIANIINAQLLFLESVDSKKPISMYINSPGGSVYAGLGIYDVMQLVSPKISTVNCGLAASMGFVLMVSGEKGMRSSLRHARFMQHQPMGGAEGQATDMEITVNEIKKLKKELYDIISHHTGQKFAKVERDADRDHWMTAAEAKVYGCVDEIMTRKSK
jgi:ATP-dependent Clp protease protease subunit